MIIKTFKKIPETSLKSFYLEFRFINPKTENQYKLPLIIQVADKLDAIRFQAELLGVLAKEMTIIQMKKMMSVSLNKLDFIKEQISISQKINGFEIIKINIEEISSQNVQKVISYTIRVNVIKKIKTPIPKGSGELFTLIIDKNVLE